MCGGTLGVEISGGWTSGGAQVFVMIIAVLVFCCFLLNTFYNLLK